MRRRAERRIVGALAGSLALLAALPAGAQESAGVATATGGDQELAATRDALATGRETIAALERKIAEIDAEIRRAEERRARAEAEAATTRARLDTTRIARAQTEAQRAQTLTTLLEKKRGLLATLGALQRIERSVPDATSPLSIAADDQIKTAILLSGIALTLRQEAQTAEDALGTLDRHAHEIDKTDARLDAVLRSLDAKRRALESEVSRSERERADAEQAQRDARARDEALSRQIAALEAAREALPADSASADDATIAESFPAPAAGHPDPPAEAASDAPVVVAARGSFVFPVTGRVVSRFGQTGQTGLAAKGIKIETQTASRIVAPFDGDVVFAGPFRGYGELLIIDHGEGYHTLLAGVGRIDARLGQRVLAGQPVGVMASGSDDHPRLYIELRHKGRPINPLPWLVAGDSKVEG